MKKITILDCFISSDKVLEKLEKIISQLKNKIDKEKPFINLPLPERMPQ